MDIATHVLLGATAGYAVGGQRVGRAAAAMGALGAALPDLDILLHDEDDSLFALEFHRHFSHSLTFALAASIVVGLILQRPFRLAGPRLRIELVLVGYLSAILLDACTSYGTLLFWPLSDERVALSIISIVDPIFSGVLVVTLLIGLHRKQATLAGVALMFCGCYLSIGALQHSRASVLFAQTMASQRPELTHMLVKPSFGNLILWRGLAWDDNQITSAAVRPSLWSNHRVYPGEYSERPDAQQLAVWSGDSKIRQDDVARFARLSAQLLIMHPSRPTLLGDARFALLPNSLEPLWGIEVTSAKASDHVDYVTNRHITAASRTHFVNMLLGRDLQ